MLKQSYKILEGATSAMNLGNLIIDKAEFASDFSELDKTKSFLKDTLKPLSFTYCMSRIQENKLFPPKSTHPNKKRSHGSHR